MSMHQREPLHPQVRRSDENHNLTALGKAIREEREFQGWSAADLADHLGCNALVMQLMEDGFWIPSDRELTLLAKALGCPAARFERLAEMARAEEALRLTRNN